MKYITRTIQKVYSIFEDEWHLNISNLKSEIDITKNTSIEKGKP